MLLRLKNVTVNITHPPLLEQINLVIDKGERIALVGRNGMGKSTLMKLLSGSLEPDAGEIELSPHCKVAMLQQEVPAGESLSVFAVVAAGLGAPGKLLGSYQSLVTQYAEDLSEDTAKKLQYVQHEMDNTNAWQTQHQVDNVLTRLALDGSQSFTSLSGGLKRRVLLAQALVNEPDLLLLDEPTNHLDIASIEWLEQTLLNIPCSVLFVSHDRAFTSKLAKRVIELDRGKLSDWVGDFDNYLRRKEEALHAESLAKDRFDKKLAEEEVWIRQGIKARRTRNEGRVRALKAMREEYSQRRNLIGKVTASIQETTAGGQEVIVTKDLCFAYTDKPHVPIIKDCTFTIMKGDKIGLVGPNGVGKTTLIQLLLKKLEPSSGTVKHGTSLQVAYFDQLREQLNPQQTVRENVGGGSDTVTINGKSKHIMSYLRDFLFPPERANSSIAGLSGGERNRLLLAKLFLKPANLLVLDEPSNDLDFETLELLEECLLEFKGTILLISHDRSLLDNITTQVLLMNGDGQVQSVISDYEQWRHLLQPTTNATTGKATTKLANTNDPKPVKNDAQKLNYNEKRELQNLPKQIETLEATIEQLQRKLASPDFYQAEPPETIKVATADLEQLQQELERLYRRWEDLDGR